ncbi:MAG: hypothetical protein R6U98_19565, partial [Pirellulaceae bacterium]
MDRKSRGEAVRAIGITSSAHRDGRLAAQSKKMTCVRQRPRDSNTLHGAPTRYAKRRSEARHTGAEDIGYLNTRRLAAAPFNWEA